MAESFGLRLRQRREARGIALRAIAEQTKIKLSLLEALERDDVSSWPSGIFRRGYIRAYAEAIGLDPDAGVREFLDAHPDREEVEPLSAIAAAAERTQAPETGALGQIRGALASLRNRWRVKEQAPAGDAALAVDDVLVDATAARSRDLGAVASLCTQLGQAQTTRDVDRLVPEMARILDATGVVVWVWDPLWSELRAALVHGYSDKVLSQLPPVKRDSDNATAAAFRSVRTCAVSGASGASGALAVPLVTPEGPAGVLALELPAGGEQSDEVRAVATILAALLAQLVVGAAPDGEATVPDDEQSPPDDPRQLRLLLA